MSAGSARPVVVDVFAGAGGLSLGFEQAGFEVAVAIEYDPIHALTYRHSFPHCRLLCRDVRFLSGNDVVAAVPNGRRVDVLIGGPSCQGFSSMGLREENDTRNLLLGEFVRLVDAIRPRAFVLENVPGLLEPRFEALRGHTWRLLRNAGYVLTGTEGCVDAEEFGVPQARRRVVVVGVLEGPAVDLSVGRQQGSVTVAEALEGLPVVEEYEELLAADAVALSATDRARRQAIRSDYARRMAGLASVGDLGRLRTWDPNFVTNSLRTVHRQDVIRRFDKTAPGEVEPTSRLFRLHPDKPARTLRAGTGRERGAHTSPRPIHPELPRVITVREAARLHGYPDWFRFAATNWHGHRQIGNSVPPPLARAIALALRSVLGGHPRRLRRAQELGDPAWLAASPSEAANLLGARQVELPPPRKRKDGTAVFAA